MRLFGPSGVRSFPTDRNPTAVNNGTRGSAAGGTNDTAITYTVPAGRRAVIEHAEISVVVTTVLAAGQSARQQIEVLPIGAQGGVMVETFLRVAAPLGEKDRADCGLIFLDATQTIRALRVVDAGTGVVLMASGIHGVEYDA